MGRWRELDHTADLALHAWGEDLEDLFGTMARGMFSLLATVADDGMVVRFDLHLRSLDTESLLIDWLNELLYFYESQELVGTEFVFELLTSTELRCVVAGRPIAERYAHIKAATYHMLKVTSVATGYETEVVFDV